MAKNESSENYLEAILMLSKKLPVVRSVDIANELGFKKSSVSIAMKKLRENGYITMDRDGLITLTESGMEIASKMLDRHHTLTRFLVAIGVDQKTAEQDACRIEHDISQQTYDAMCAHAQREADQGVAGFDAMNEK